MSVPRMSGYLASRKQKDNSVNISNQQFTEKNHFEESLFQSSYQDNSLTSTQSGYNLSEIFRKNEYVMPNQWSVEHVYNFRSPSEGKSELEIATQWLANKNCKNSGNSRRF